MTDASPHESLERAVRIVGSQSAMARLLGVSQAAVWKWLHERKHLPAEHVLTVEAETSVSKHALRPDIYGSKPVTAQKVLPEQSDLGDSTPVPIR